ncbi:MAG: nitrous oxide reductase accessory protein NosL [Desulfobacteraceae bacterium]|nr:MAG: nitrous oxide reductase accessory protein NosL [Desulfobacteraceae bacterium]
MEKIPIRRLHIASCLAVLFVLLILDISWGADVAPGKPSRQDKCPVCGMFVYKYPDWVGEIVFKNGKRVFFDGAKDLFKYYFDLKKYAPGSSIEDIAATYVSEYYGMKPIKAEEGFFVIGSDVYGPMGRELIPFSSGTDAETFLADHKGKTVLKFRDVTRETIQKLD